MQFFFCNQELDPKDVFLYVLTLKFFEVALSSIEYEKVFFRMIPR